MRFSRNVDTLEPSATLALAARARRLREEGRSIVNLSAGEPVYGTPDFAAHAGIEAIRAGKMGYPPNQGIPELRRAIVDYLEDTTGSAGLDPEGVLVSAGVKQALFNCLFCLAGPGDEVLVPTPCWTSYRPQVRLGGAEPVLVESTWEDGFHVDVDRLEAARTDATRVLLLNSPNNPSGAVYDLDSLREIADWASGHGVWILSDEIYRRLRFGDGPAPSLLDLGELPDRAVVLDGVSKAFAMTGWRIGFALGPRELIRKASDLQSQTTSGAAAPSQYAAAAAFGRIEEREAVVADFLDRLGETRRLAIEGLAGMPGLEVRPPEGGIFLWARIGGDASSAEVAEGLLEAGVACIPGEAFESPGHLRFNLAVEPSDLEQGMRRVRSYFESLERA
ncbi:MAG: pyridoxal phosphate-dependent aminotransferase [Candidatus Palauibacterales bacterium]|nr:pyridoxal phosphate-dependent aminotransferase [Candidatus Palauibacterales bacterium]MDP2529322.1 pyridoxal phosphate-dependent aminotransferase [Candidatus Palauibacterales bacterium]MDP2583271.1 pyridoxal phosphate-dependent aminotransferase [Candidatus Palauibacterales bacterium]